MANRYPLKNNDIVQQMHSPNNYDTRITDVPTNNDTQQ